MTKTDMSRIKVVTIDVDGCLVSYDNVGSPFHSSWDALGYAYGLKERWDERTRENYDALRGTNDEQWARADTADLKGRKVEDSFKVLYPIPYCNGAREFADASKQRFRRGILSTAIDLVAEKAAEELGLDFCLCNVLHRQNGNFTGTLDYNVPTWLKHIRLLRVCRKCGVWPEEICHIGDNDNDIGVAEKTGTFIALNSKTEAVKQVADYVAKDFFEVGKILGVLK